MQQCNFTLTNVRMLAQDLMRFGTIYFIFLMGFGQAYYLIFMSYDNEEEDNPMQTAMDSVLQVCKHLIILWCSSRYI